MIRVTNCNYLGCSRHINKLNWVVMSTSPTAFSIPLLLVAHYVIYINAAPPPLLIIIMAEGCYCPINNNIRHQLCDSDLRVALIKNHLSEPEFPWLQTGINRDDVNSRLFLYSSVIIWKWVHTQPAAENEYWSEHEGKHETLKVERIFSLACHRVSFDFPSMRVTAAGFLPLPWWKHEWSCCQTGTQVFNVASMSAGHMSKGSVWINDFSRDWWAVTDVRACFPPPPPASLCFLIFFAGVNDIW